MKTRTADLLSLAAIAAVCLFGLVIYADLPEQIPTHWNAAGEIDDYTAKPWGAFVLPFAAAMCWLLMKVIPLISPRGFRTGGFQDVINVFQFALVLFLSVTGVLVLLAAMGVEMFVTNVISLGVGLLFIVLGNYLGKVRKNFFIGIRTPWTLASDEVWARTHRLGGWVFAACGLLIMATSFMEPMPLLLVALVAPAALIPVVYSFFAYRRLEGFADDEEPGEEADQANGPGRRTR